jgi:hypothetical protein
MDRARKSGPSAPRDHTEPSQSRQKVGLGRALNTPGGPNNLPMKHRFDTR